jgi:DNA-binding PadR family transcriptional regulator
MALEHAILVALSERPGSGYELARRFDRSIGYFWNASHQQVYRVLGRMDEAGWLVSTAVEQDGRPDKKIYEVSADGASELARWLALPTEPEPIRHDLAVKIRGAGYGDARGVLADVVRHREQHAARLEMYLAIEKRDFASPARLKDHQLHQYLVLRGGISYERGVVEWCDEVIQALGKSTVKGTR